MNQWIRKRRRDDYGTDRLLLTPRRTHRSSGNHSAQADHQSTGQPTSGHSHLIRTQRWRSRSDAIGRKRRRDKGYH
jgi:hypothetical protein